MSEEKETLKERLSAIMKYSKKSKAAVLMSIALLVAAIGGAVMLGGCIGKTNQDVFQDVFFTEVFYENKEFGFSLLIPKDFIDTVEIKEMGDRVFFVNKEIQATLPEHVFGVVGRIEIFDKGEFTRENLKENEDIYGLRYLGENEKYYFGWAHATDVQVLPEASEQLKEQYRSMEGKFGEMIKSFKIINTSEYNLTNEHEVIKDNFYESVNYDPGQGLLKFTIPKTIPEGYRFYLHVSGRMYMGDKSNGMSFHAFDEETQNYSWEKGKTYTYPLKSDSLDECLLVFGLIDKNSRELLYTIRIYCPYTSFNDGYAKSIESTINTLTSSATEHEAPYHLTIKDGVITEILEQY